jgi:hypothetical protein
MENLGKMTENERFSGIIGKSHGKSHGKLVIGW